jgi:hypothetical protein
VEFQPRRAIAAGIPQLIFDPWPRRLPKYAEFVILDLPLYTFFGRL